MGLMDMICCNAAGADSEGNNRTSTTSPMSRRRSSAAGSGRWTTPVIGRCPDPSLVYVNGRYYLTMSRNASGIYQMSSNSLATLAQAKPKLLWEPGYVSSTASTPTSASSTASFQNERSQFGRQQHPVDQVWAPEMAFVFGNWYIYFTASCKRGDDWHRLYCLASTTGRPEGPYNYVGQVSTNDGLPDGQWAIDPTLFTTHDNQVWLCYSGNCFGSDNTAGNQKLHLLPLRNPITPLDRHRPTIISQPDHPYERNHGRDGIYWVNEGPSALVMGNTVYIAFAASFCDKPWYSIGLLTATIPAGLSSTEVLTNSPYTRSQSEPYDKYTFKPSNSIGPASNVWRKSLKPILSMNSPGLKECGMFGIGGGQFFKSPSGSEHYYAFHFTKNSEGSMGEDRATTVVRVQLSASSSSKKGAVQFVSSEGMSEPARLPAGDPMQQQVATATQ